MVNSMIEPNQDLIIRLEFHVVFMVLSITFREITFLAETAPRVV